jgi:hypothetical protein
MSQNTLIGLNKPTHLTKNYIIFILTTESKKYTILLNFLNI